MNKEAQSVFTIKRVLEHSAEQFANRPALVGIGEEPMTYGELYEAVQGLSHLLEEQGVRFGDKVAILSENCPQWGVAYFAVTCLGAVAIPILTEFHSDAIVHIIRHSEAKAVFVSEKLFPKLEGAAFDPAPALINLESFTPMSDMSRDTLRDLKAAGYREFRKLKEMAMRWTHRAPQEPEEEDVAAIIYTSGTTGHSKGVVLTHKNIVSDAKAILSIFPLTKEDILLSILPLPHTFECTLGLVYPIACGSSVHYLGKAPTARVLLPAFAAVQPTALLSVPLVIEKIFKFFILPKLTTGRMMKWLCGFSATRRIICRKAGKKLHKAFGGRLRIMAIGGAPLAADAERFLREAGFPYAIGYGLTEASPILTGSTPERTRLSSAGIPLQGIQVRLGNVNEATGEGEIEAFGPNIMRGYYKMPELTAEVFTEDGWLRTGDLGAIDKDGYVYIKGRSKNVIIGPSGENIYPEEVESFFFTSPYVLEVLVYELADRLAARVYLEQDKVEEFLASHQDKTREDLLESIRQSVNSKVSVFARIHKIIEQAEPFEKTATQKIKRYLYVDMQ